MASNSKNSEYPAFTNFTIKVDVKESSWPRTVTKILNSVQGVTNFKMENNGKINISGYIEPIVLLKCLRKAGKSAQLVHWQYGECSNNLYVKTTDSTTKKNENRPYGYSLYPGYGGYNGYGSPGYGSNHAYNHIECAGNASDCNGQHIEKPRTPEQSASSSSSGLFKKLSSITSCVNGANCCSLCD